MRKIAAVIAFLAAIWMCTFAYAELDIRVGEDKLTNGMWNEEHTQLVTPFRYPQLLEGIDPTVAEAVIAELLEEGYSMADLYEPFTAGWSGDGTFYVSYEGIISVQLPEDCGAEMFRVASFYPADNGEIYGNYQIVETQASEGGAQTIWFSGVHVSDKPGLYENITLVVTGRNDVFIRTFDVYIAGLSEEMSHPPGLAEGISIDGDEPHLYTAQRYVYGEKHAIPAGDFIIPWPAEGSVHTGYDGVKVFSDLLLIQMDPALPQPEMITVTLTEMSTGKVVAQSRQAEPRMNHFDGYQEYTVVNAVDEPFVLPDTWEPGVYRLTYEVGGVGTHWVDIVLEKETLNPAQYYEPYAQGELRLVLLQDKLNHDYFGSWNEDFSVFQADESSMLGVKAGGLVPGQRYFCALSYTNEQGQKWTETKPVFGEEDVVFFLSSRAGTYKDLTLTLVGNGEVASHTFDCIVPRDSSGNVNGVLMGRYTDYYVGPVEDPEKQELVIPDSGFTLHTPRAGTYVGAQGSRLSVELAFSENFPSPANVDMTLTEVSTGVEVAHYRAMYSDLGGNCWDFGGNLQPFKPLTAGEYTLRVRAPGGDYSVTVTLESFDVDELIQEQLRLIEMKPQYTERGLISYPKRSIIPEIIDFLGRMTLVETDAYELFTRYGYRPEGQGMLRDFAILEPNVEAVSVENELSDLTQSANALLRDAYAFQQRGMRFYGSGQLVDVQAMNTFCAGGWKNLQALECAAGTAEDASGAVYTWVPVYYPDDQGGLWNNELYLFVYITYPGADEQWLAPFHYYDPSLYAENHTTRLLVTDQAVVAQWLSILRESSLALEHLEDDTPYKTLQRGSESEAVRRLQVRLRELGYLTASADGYYSPRVEIAVKAYQAAMGLEPTGIADAHMQRMIHDPSLEKQILLDWLASRVQ